jgi:hypothetical protein
MLRHGHIACGFLVHFDPPAPVVFACGPRVCGMTRGLSQAPVSDISWKWRETGVTLLLSFPCVPPRKRRRAKIRRHLSAKRFSSGAIGRIEPFATRGEGEHRADEWRWCERLAIVTGLVAQPVPCGAPSPTSRSSSPLIGLPIVKSSRPTCWVHRRRDGHVAPLILAGMRRASRWEGAVPSCRHTPCLLAPRCCRRGRNESWLVGDSSGSGSLLSWWQ